MKNIFILIGLCIGFSIPSLQAQKKVEEAEFQVAGVCGMCEKRIEAAVDVKGVLFADWNKETQKLSIAYKSDKINRDQILVLLSEAGHDAEEIKASDEAYNNLHKCCRYREMDMH